LLNFISKNRGLSAARLPDPLGTAENSLYFPMEQGIHRVETGSLMTASTAKIFQIIRCLVRASASIKFSRKLLRQWVCKRIAKREYC
jgi:hypothetical protein